MAKSVRQELEVIRLPKRSTTILLIMQIYLVKHEMPIFQCFKGGCFIAVRHLILFVFYYSGFHTSLGAFNSGQFSHLTPLGL